LQFTVFVSSTGIVEYHYVHIWRC